MNIHFYTTVERVERDGMRDAHAVIIDVLRMGSTVAAALENGARGIVPVRDVTAAKRIARSSKRSRTILAGERGGRRIAGFDLGNSPLEFTAPAIAGKTVVITTTNGTRGIAAAAESQRVVVGSINNIGAVARFVGDAAALAVVCCGTRGRSASEDILCGGMLLSALGGAIREEMLDGSARAALSLARDTGAGIERYLHGCESGRMLVQLGYEADVAWCARLDISRVVPVVRNGMLRAAD